MSESNPNPDNTTAAVSSVAELAAAFGAKAGTPQDQTQTQDQKDESLGSSQESGSSTEGTSDSSTASSPSREEIIAGLTLDELRTHPTLGPQIQSYAQSEGAAQLKGKTESIRRELQRELAQKQFAAMDKEELGQLLANDDEAAKLYAEIQSAPPPTTTTTSTGDPIASTVSFFTQAIRTTSSKLASSDLSAEDKAALDPNKHLQAADHPGKSAEEILAAWQLKVDNAITDARVKSATASLTESLNLDNQAKGDESNSKPGASMSNGIRTTPLPDLITTPGSTLLADAFARQGSRSK